MDIERPYIPPSGISRAAKIMGIVSLVTSFMGLGFIFGALAIIFAVLSKDENSHFTKEGMVGIIMGSIAIFYSAFLFVYIFVDPMAHQALNEQCYAFNGMTFDEMIEQLKTLLVSEFSL